MGLNQTKSIQTFCFVINDEFGPTLKKAIDKFTKINNAITNS